MRRLTLLTTLLATLLAGLRADCTAAERPKTVRDCIWIWGHYEGSYDNDWGLPKNSPITPLQGARSMGVQNLIMIRYKGKPAPPYDAYAAQFRGLKKILWSVTGAGGVTSNADRDQTFALAAKMPNITGVFMDDFFHGTREEWPQWLAENNVRFPVVVTLTLPRPTAVDKIVLAQTTWKTGDYRTARFAVELSGDKVHFKEAARGSLPNVSGAEVALALPKGEVRAVRVRILGTHDTGKAKSCGLSQLRLHHGGRCLDLKDAAVESSSVYAGHPAKDMLRREAPASLSVEDLRQLRKRLTVGGRKLDLGVTLYVSQLDPRITAHLQQCDVVSLWTWESANLAHLEENLAKFQALMPGKRVLLGLYMWDFSDARKPMPVELMKKQCGLALRWLREGRIEGMIFLATNICDMNLEAVHWSRRWIAEVGDQPLGEGVRR